ncbi:MAG: Holliday junction branch migration protein RuvA [Candidatus Wildermuthbacteria bacterium]|nr:Holliday junction branch migration protein RuvA [Candidatus Wildermuthbacteria bacterium]
MISYIKGKVIAKGSDYIITEAGGIGYKVFVSGMFLVKMTLGKEIEAYCHLHIRQEETLELYGVESAEALELFELLRGISGIGPKVALAISSLGNRGQLERAVKEGNEKFFAGVRGIGQKRLQKIMLELTGSFRRAVSPKQEEDEAVDALAALGFTRQKARDALSKIGSSIETAEERVKAALRHIQ